MNEQARPISRLDYFLQFIFQPQAIASVAPSSQALGDVMMRYGKVAEADYVVEFGPGTGAITQVICRTLKEGAGFLAIEMNPKFVELIREHYPEVHTVHDDALNTRTHMEEQGVSHCDTLISGLPFAAFGDGLQSGLLNAAYDILRPGGRFVTFTYIHSPFLPRGNRFRDKLRERFGNVERTPVVWRNLPPAFAYVAQKPES